jgi:1-acyl-sn-glycerol-3-phosphate acyltransferase
MSRGAVVLLVVSLTDLAVIAVVMLIAVRAMRRWKLTFGQALLMHGLNALLNRVLWHTKVDRPLPIEPGKGAVVIANHRSSFDPMFVAMTTGRLIHWMVAREYCVDRRLAWFFRLLDQIPTGRGGVDSAAIKQAIRLASEGELVGMLPEGRINVGDELLLPGRPGAVLVALKAQVPIVPCYIEGAPYGGIFGPFIRPAHVRVKVGDPIDLSEYFGRDRDPELMAELTKRCLKAMAHLAGRDDFVPQVAGRRWLSDVQEATNGGQ